MSDISDSSKGSNNDENKGSDPVTGDSNPKLEFKSTTGTHSIVVELDTGRHEALINTMNIQPGSPVELALLLKHMSDELKKIHIHYIIQQIGKQEWEGFLKAKRIFEFVNENKRYGFVNVRCRTEIFPESVMKGLGFVEL